MFLIYLVCISALTVDVKCECDQYIDCFGEFLQTFFGYNNGTDAEFDRDGNSSKYIEVEDTGEEIEKVLSDVSDLIKVISGGVEQTSDVKESDDIKIFVKTFDFDHNYEDFVQTTQVDDIKSTTENVDFTATSTEHKAQPFMSRNGVIHLKSDTENEISKESAYYKDVSSDTYYDERLDERLDDNSTDYPIIDYIEVYKDTTNEEVEYKGTEPPAAAEERRLSDEIREKEKDIENVIDDSLTFLQDDSLNNLIKKQAVKTCGGDKSSLSDAVFPWIAAIFVKNDSKGFQYEYFCDGAQLSKKIVLTSARCVLNGSSTFNPEDFIVILGKKSLQASAESEKIHKVDKVTVHSNFSASDVSARHDLALLELESEIELSQSISRACSITDEAHFDEKADAVTTAWSLSGDLTLIFFDKERSKACGSDNKVENTFFATYGNDVALCPSYGGVYVSRASDDRWYLQGIRHGNPQERGVCFLKDVEYTALSGYSKWIEDVINKD